MVAVQIEGLAITEILVEEGDRVKAGQILARLSRETIDTSLAQNAAHINRATAAIAQAESQIAEAEAMRAQTQASFSRAQTLRSQGIASAETFDQRQASAQQAEARLQSARQTLRLAEADRALAEAQRSEWQVRLGRTEIRSPADGVISRRSARLGAIAAAVGEPLFRLIRDGAIELEAEVADGALARVAVGQPAAVRPAGQEKDIAGSVRLVSPEITRSTRLGRVRIAFADTPGLALGGFARGTVEVARREGVLAPLSAVLFTPEGPRVQVARDGIVETRRVTTGIRSGGRIEITEGLAAGELLVAISGTFLRHGDRITPVPAK
jgi:HlyD family secretion protein